MKIDQYDYHNMHQLEQRLVLLGSGLEALGAAITSGNLDEEITVGLGRAAGALGVFASECLAVQLEMIRHNFSPDQEANR
jgi:hypothetical protein